MLLSILRLCLYLTGIFFNTEKATAPSGGKTLLKTPEVLSGSGFINFLFSVLQK